MFNKFSTKHSAVQNREVGASSFIPYLCHFNENTILTKKNDLVSFIRIEGFPFEAADDEEIDSKKEIRNNVFKAMTGGNFSIYIHTIRKKHASYPNGEFENDFANALNKQWKEKNAPEYGVRNVSRMPYSGAVVSAQSVNKLSRVNRRREEPNVIIESLAD